MDVGELLLRLALVFDLQVAPRAMLADIDRTARMQGGYQDTVDLGDLFDLCKEGVAAVGGGEVREEYVAVY